MGVAALGFGAARVTPRGAGAAKTQADFQLILAGTLLYSKEKSLHNPLNYWTWSN